MFWIKNTDGKKDAMLTFALISFFVVNFMLYPTLCKEAMMVFSCVSIGDSEHWFMNGDYDVECLGPGQKKSRGQFFQARTFLTVARVTFPGLPRLIFFPPSPAPRSTSPYQLTQSNCSH